MHRGSVPALLAALACAAGPASVAAEDRGTRIESEARRVESEILAIRHDLHEHPELSNREERTARIVADYCRKLGLEVRTQVARHGVVALLRGGRPGPTVAVRADLDALPVTEENALPFRSKVRTEYLGQEVGVMHACGHDVHAAVQLGVAAVLAALRQDLPGTVKLIFQPAEEGPPRGEEGGARLMIAEGVLEDPKPSAIFGLHTFSEMAVGEVGYTEGPAFAAADTFEVKIHGKQSHGASPHLAVDPVVAAAQFVLALQTIRSRSLPPLEPSVVTVGAIRGGQRHNIIPSEVLLLGTVRSYSPEVRATIRERFRALLDGITAAAGARGEILRYDGIPATVNDPGLGRQSLPSLVRVLGREKVKRIPPTMGGEDFAYFAQAIPGFFFRLGSVKPGTQSGDHHTPTFLADDGSVPVGIRAMCTLVADYLDRHR